MNEKYLVTPQTSADIARQAEERTNESLEEIHGQRAVSYLVPSWAGIVFYFFGSMAILAALNLRTLLQAIANTQPSVSGEFSQVVSGQIVLYGSLPIVSWATIILFWGTVGLGVYTLFWLGMAFITAARNEVVVETAFSNRGHFQDRVRVPLIKLLLIGGIIMSLFLTVRFGLPMGVGLFSSGLYQLFVSIPVGIALISIAILGGMITIYILRTLIVYFRHAEGIF
jgi:hypothetical protein